MLGFIIFIIVSMIPVYKTIDMFNLSAKLVATSDFTNRGAPPIKIISGTLFLKNLQKKKRSKIV